MELGEMLGWMQTFFEQLGIWQTIKTALTAVIILATASAVIRFAKGT